MIGYVTFLMAVLVSVTWTQETTLLASGTRLLWIPFKTIPGTPLASIAQEHTNTNETVYVVSCPSAQPDCDIAPNITLTEGPSNAGYSTTNSAGIAFIGCSIAGPTNAVCSDIASGQGQVVRGTTSTLAPSQIVYQAVKVTATSNDTSHATASDPASTAGSPSSQGTASSAAGAIPTSVSWSLCGALGVILAVLAAL